jgi:hypothetical protein
MAVASAVGLVMAGCGFFAPVDVNAILKQLAEENNVLPQRALTIRIVNLSDGLTEQLVVRIDDELQTLTCEAGQSICDFDLAFLPDRVEAIEERRLDADDNFAGGRTLDGQDAFSFTSDDYDFGSTIIYEFSETAASAEVL